MGSTLCSWCVVYGAHAVDTILFLVIIITTFTSHCVYSYKIFKSATFFRGYYVRWKAVEHIKNVCKEKLSDFNVQVCVFDRNTLDMVWCKYVILANLEFFVTCNRRHVVCYLTL